MAEFTEDITKQFVKAGFGAAFIKDIVQDDLVMFNTAQGIDGYKVIKIYRVEEMPHEDEEEYSILFIGEDLDNNLPVHESQNQLAACFIFRKE